MARQRLRTIGQVAADIRDIVIRPHTRLPVLTCTCCGKEFLYRGIQDADCVSGSTWDAISQTYIPSGGKVCLCNNCKSYVDYYD